MPKVSIIVPVYNTESHLQKCLDSLVNQSFKDIEILIINDGSTDNSINIINEYIKQYPSILKYYFKSNEGLAIARNYGVSLATGDYIMFVDSDDYLDSNILFDLNKYMEQNIELIKYKITIDYINQNQTIIQGPTFNAVSGEDAFNLLVYNDTLLESACAYLYKKSLFENNNLQFTPNTYHEDFGLIPLIILNANSVVSTNISGYHYTQSANSITRNSDYKRTIKKAYDLLIHYDILVSKLKDLNISDQSKNNLKLYFTNSIILKTNSLEKNDQKKYIQEIKKRNLIKNIKVTNLKQLIKKILLKVNINLYLKLR